MGDTLSSGSAISNSLSNAAANGASVMGAIADIMKDGTKAK